MKTKIFTLLIVSLGSLCKSAHSQDIQAMDDTAGIAAPCCSNTWINSDTAGHPCYRCSEELRQLHPKILFEYFLLGTLGGGSWFKPDGKTLDHYFPGELPRKRAIYRFAQQYFPEQAGLFADDTAKYIYAPEWVNIRSEYMTDGVLIKDKFTSGEQIYSFLLGMYFRHGRKLSDINFELHELGPDLFIRELLEKTECYKIYTEYMSTRYYVPDMTRISFQASPILAKYFALAGLSSEKGEWVDHLNEAMGPGHR